MRYTNFTAARTSIEREFAIMSKRVHTKRWQGVDITKRPDMVTFEILNKNVSIDLKGVMDISHWAKDIQPNLPWADDHFEERVGGAPLNPGIQWRNWPWATSANQHRDDKGMFNHTYMQRLWPRNANQMGPVETHREFFDRFGETGVVHSGIRGEYGDLNTLVDKLAWDPLTRQAYIPLYFPEDTGLEGRMPCTLGYQVILRDNRLHMFYPLRSCDFVRHWPDDCYLAVRLLLWIIEECRKINPIDWDNVTPGDYVMHMTSFHVFVNDYNLLREKVK